MSQESEELAVQLLDKLRTVKRQVESLRSEAIRIQELKEQDRDFVVRTGWQYGSHADLVLSTYRWKLTDMEKIADQVNDRILSLELENSVVSQLEQVINSLPEVQITKRRNEVMKETNDLEKRELELKKSIASKQAESEKISKGLRRVVGFSFVLATSFTTVGILFPQVWVLCVTTIFVGIITLFIGLNMLFGLCKDGIIDAGKVEKDKVELAWVQPRKAQLFLESNQ